MPEKKRIRIVGWDTPNSRRKFGLFSFTMPRTIRTSIREVPKSANIVYCLDMDVSPPHVLKLKREDLANYQVI